MIGMLRMVNNSTRQTFLIAAVALLCLAAAWRGAKSADGSANDGYGVKFTNVARAAGIAHKTVYGDERKNKYLLETTGCGVAWFDYDNDGWLDLFFVNGTRLGGFPKGEEPTTRLYHNNRDGTFSDVTKQSGLARAGWGSRSASAITTTPASTIFSFRTTARTRSIRTTARARSRTFRRRPAWPAQRPDGGAARRLSTTTRTATSTSSSPITSTSTSRPRRRRRPARVCTKA